MLETTLDIAAVFPQLEPALLDEISRYGVLRLVGENEVLVRTGEFINDTLLVCNGLVKVYREDSHGSEYFMYYLHSGQACALTINCAVQQQNSPVVAKAVQDTELISLPVNVVQQWFQQYRSWNHFVLDQYRERYMDLLDTLDNVAFHKMDERLELYLKQHREKMETSDIRITHQEIAGELNSSREVVSRLLKKMADDGKIVLHRYHIEIINL